MSLSCSSVQQPQPGPGSSAGCSAEGLAELKADSRVGACVDPTTINSTTPLHSKLLPLNISRTISKSPVAQPCVTEQLILSREKIPWQTFECKLSGVTLRRWKKQP